MLMVAIREHGYQGRRVKLNQKFEVLSVKDATVLRAAKLARNATEAERAEWLKARSTPAPIPVPAPAEKIEEPIVYETRDEEPEEVEKLESEEDSPQETKKRKQRRQYKRNDMVPED